MDYQFWATVILSVALVVVFIGVFYFTVASGIEAQVVQDQMAIIVGSFASDVSHIATSDQLAAISGGLQAATGTPSAELQAADASAEKANSALRSQAFVVLGAAFGVLMVIFAYLVYNGKRSSPAIQMDHVAQDAFGGLAAVAVAYAAFAFLFASKYISADTNWVKLQLIQALQQQAAVGTSQSSGSSAIENPIHELQKLSSLTLAGNM